ncbi:MAG: DUF2267 domain-containing protein [Candidatus Latescibacterota bacterium]
MDYDSFLREVMHLDFIDDGETADAAVKTILRILTSRLDEPVARNITEKLPPQLSYDNLHAKHGSAVLISLDEAVTKIAAQFRLEIGQSARLIGTVLDTVNQAIGIEGTRELEQHLPSDWVSMLRKGPTPYRQYIIP